MRPYHRVDRRERRGAPGPVRTCPDVAFAPLRDQPVAPWPAGPGAHLHERAVASPGLDRTDGGEATPGFADGRWRHAERTRELAHGRQLGVRRKVTGGDHSTDRGGDRL